jgi:magnesium transporter
MLDGAASMTTQSLLANLRASIADRNPDAFATLVADASPRELAIVIRWLDPADAVVLLQWLPDDRLPGLLAELDPSDAAAIVRTMSRPAAASLLGAMAPDDATDVIVALPDSHVEPILGEMRTAAAAEIRTLLAYPPDSAGGIMTPAFVAMEPGLRADRAIAALRKVAEEAETIYYVYVTDPDDRLIGVLSLYRLVLSPPETPVRELMVANPIRVRADSDQETAARLLTDRNLLALPVVDAEDRLLGIITHDDVADVLEREATEDMYRMAGIGVQERATSPMLESARRRVPWLSFNMAWSHGSAFIVSAFQPTIERAAVLAVFMPVIAGQAGNAGIQTATIVIRSLALGEISPRDTLHILGKELGVGLIKGGIFGVALFLIATIWKGNPELGVVAGLALFLNIAIVATASGVLLPMILVRLGKDPATIAGVFDTMLSDLMGNLIYLGLATLLIHWII